jgi:predicted transcriptional regulator of viral defense system
MAVLKSSAWAMRPRDIAGELGISIVNAKQTLSRMARDGQIARWSRGEYIMPDPECDSGSYTPPDDLPPALRSKWFQSDSENDNGS